MITFKQFVHKGSLSDLPIVLALRKELQITRKDAEETLAWVRGEDVDLPDSAYIPLGFIFYTGLKKLEQLVRLMQKNSSRNGCHPTLKRSITWT